MDLDDLGKPITTGRAGRVILGVVFLAFAAVSAFGAVAIVWGANSYYFGLLALFVLLAIVVGYVGYRLVKIVDHEHLLGRSASFVAAVIMIASGVAIAVWLVRAPPSDNLVDELLLAVGSVVCGWWLMRSTIRRKDEP